MSDEKMIRFDVESGSFDAKIERMGENVRRAFNIGDFNSILAQADRQFTNLNEKANFLKEKFDEIKANRTDYQSGQQRLIRDSETDPIQKERRLDDLYSEMHRSPEAIAFRNFGDKIKEMFELLKKQQVDEERDKNEKSPNDPPIQPPGGGGEGFSERFGQFGGNLLGVLNKGFLGALAAYGAAITALVKFGKEGYNDLRSENAVRRKVDITDDFGDDPYLSRLDMSRGEFRDVALQTAGTRRSGFDLQRQTLMRATLGRSYGLEQGEFGNLDQFYRAGSGGVNTNDANGNMDAVRVIANILMRSERQGILGMSGKDFSMAPEKIAQVSAIMGMQFNSGEKTDANAAINLMLAGQKIGGRFADQRFGEAMGSINSSIQSPGSPGMRAFVFESLRRSNPSASYTDLMGQMENGASAENLRAILPAIARLPQGEMRRMMLQQFTKNWQNANTLDKAGNLKGMLSQLDEMPMGEGDFAAQMGKAATRNDKTTTEMDRTWSAIKNSVSETAGNTAKILDQILKNPPSTLFMKLQTGGAVQNGMYNEYYKRNVLEAGSPTGEQNK